MGAKPSPPDGEKHLCKPVARHYRCLYEQQEKPWATLIIVVCFLASVSDPANPKQVGSVRLGGIINRTPHPARADMPLSGGPQMVEVSRDGRRVYFTNSLYGAWDDQFYPDGVGAWMAKLDADPDGGLIIDESFFPHGEEFRGLRVHQIRLQGGDASSDSYCYS